MSQWVSRWWLTDFTDVALACKDTYDHNDHDDYGDPDDKDDKDEHADKH